MTPSRWGSPTRPGGKCKSGRGLSGWATPATTTCSIVTTWSRSLASRSSWAASRPSTHDGATDCGFAVGFADPPRTDLSGSHDDTDRGTLPYTAASAHPPRRDDLTASVLGQRAEEALPRVSG